MHADPTKLKMRQLPRSYPTDIHLEYEIIKDFAPRARRPKEMRQLPHNYPTDIHLKYEMIKDFAPRVRRPKEMRQLPATTTRTLL